MISLSTQCRRLPTSNGRARHATSLDYVNNVAFLIRTSSSKQSQCALQGRTQADLLRRHIEMQTGDVLCNTRVTDDIQRLSALGVFEEVVVQPVMPSQAFAGDDDGDESGAQSSTSAAANRVHLDYRIHEKKKFASFSCSGGATVVRASNVA